MSVTLKHSWPDNSADISELVPSWAMLGQYLTTPSGDTARHQGVWPPSPWPTRQRSARWARSEGGRESSRHWARPPPLLYLQTTSLRPLTSQAQPPVPSLTVTSAPSPLRVSTSVTVTGSEAPHNDATWLPVVSITCDLNKNKWEPFNHQKILR